MPKEKSVDPITSELLGSLQSLILFLLAPISEDMAFWGRKQPSKYVLGWRLFFWCSWVVRIAKNWFWPQQRPFNLNLAKNQNKRAKDPSMQSFSLIRPLGAILRYPYTGVRSLCSPPFICISFYLLLIVLYLFRP